MSHNHGTETNSYNRAFALGVVLNLLFILAEVIFGIIGDSLALLADAGHNLSDVLGLLLAWGASYLEGLRPSNKRTYGWRSSTIMAALLNALLLAVAVGAIITEAIRRLSDPSSAAGPVIILVAAIGVVINTVTALLFLKGRKDDLNIKGAFLHMAADAGVSAGVVVAGIAIWSTGLLWIDPVVSLLVALVVLVSTVGLFKDSVNLSLQAVPNHIDIDRVREYLLDLPDVTGVHDLHIWALSTKETAITVHLIKPDPEGDDELIAKTAEELRTRFGLNHATIQWEREQPSDRLCKTTRCEI